MLSRQLETMARHLGEAPEDLDAWTRLARFCRRTGRMPPVEGRAALAWIAAAWRRAPRDRTLAPLFLAAAGLEPDPGAEPAPWFRRKRRALGRGGDAYDARFGVPLAVRHRATGMELRWLPAPPASHPGLMGYYAGRYPVRVGEYAAFLAAAGHRLPVDMLGRDPWPLQLRGPGRPVVLVSCEDARSFCTWAGGLLPDGALWSWAARGPAWRRFPWGEEPPREGMANFNHGVPWRGGDWDRYLAPCEGRAEGEGPFGLRDMAGNVREWSEERVQVAGEWSLGGAGPFKHVVRGGSWGSTRLEELEVEWRDDLLEPGTTAHDVGFRLLLPVPCATIPVSSRDGPPPAGNPRALSRARRRRRRKRRLRRA
jgi:hypothetical protein